MSNTLTQVITIMMNKDAKSKNEEEEKNEEISINIKDTTSKMEYSNTINNSTEMHSETENIIDIDEKDKETTLNNSIKNNCENINNEYNDERNKFEINDEKEEESDSGEKENEEKDLKKVNEQEDEKEEEKESKENDKQIKNQNNDEEIEYISKKEENDKISEENNRDSLNNSCNNNSLLIAEKEIEECYDRIARLKEKLIESRKGQFCADVKISEREVLTVIDKVSPIIESEESMLVLEPPIYICGDIHGQFYDLLRVFDILKYPPESKILFLGDYVDRGKKSLECILLLLCLKIKYPSRIFLLRGNHESADVNRTYGFYDECKRKMSIKIYKKFCILFNSFPITALVGEKILCMHGGLAQKLKNLDQLKEIKRPTEIPESGLLCDLVWSDPDENLRLDFKKNNERGISVCFSKETVEKFTEKNGLDLICRAHQVVEEGFQFFANMKLITIFTAPNYMEEFDNKGGILKVNEDLVCSLTVLKPDINRISNRKRRFYSQYIN